MTYVANLSDRAVRWLLIAAALAVLFGGGLLVVDAWKRHTATADVGRYQRALDSLGTVAAAQRDTIATLAERYRVDTVRVRETTTVYRAAAAAIASAPPVVTAHGDSVRADTFPVVRELARSCAVTIAARDTALSVCDQRIAAVRRGAVLDSERGAVALALEAAASKVTASRALHRGRWEGALGLLAAGVAASFLTRR